MISRVGEMVHPEGNNWVEDSSYTTKQWLGLLASIIKYVEVQIKKSTKDCFTD